MGKRPSGQGTGAVVPEKYRLPVIKVQQKPDKRVTMWTVTCDDHDSVGLSDSKAGATRVALAHAESVHNRAARIQVPS